MKSVIGLQFSRPAPVFARASTSVAGHAIRPMDEIHTLTMSSTRSDEVCITGLGVVSAAGVGVDAFGRALRETRSGIREIDRWDTSGMRPRRAGLIRSSALRPHEVDTARLDPLQRYALVAMGEAIASARLTLGPNVNDQRVALFVALARGSAAAERHLSESSHTHITNLLAARFGIRGHVATVSEGATAGLHALVQAREFLRRSPDVDAVIVVASDELGGLTTRMYDELGRLAHPAGPGGEVLRPYAPRAGGMILGEGAAAVVLERTLSARRRGAIVRASIAGCALTSDCRWHLWVDAHGHMLTTAIQTAIKDAGAEPTAIDAIYGHGRGLPDSDRRELFAFARAFAAPPSLGSITAAVGFAEAASGLFTVVAAVLGMESDRVFSVGDPGVSTPQDSRVLEDSRSQELKQTVVAGSTESGSNAAIVLKRPERG